MLVEKAIEERKSARKFSSKMVPQDLIDKIINAGRLAPSAKNKQPWLYYQVNKEQKNQIAKELLDIYRKIDAPNSTLKATALIIEQAPILVLVFQIEYDDFYNKSYLLSMGASIENCLLQATALGVQSL